mgnify:CR=1 FL=1
MIVFYIQFSTKKYFFTFESSYNCTILNHTIKQIAAQDTYKVRQPVLREGKPIESCIFANDDLKTTIHLGLFSNEKLVGVASFLKNKNDLILESGQYQLRGMAILKAFQGKGLGKLILEHAESELKKTQTMLEKPPSTFIKNVITKLLGNLLTLNQ